MGTVGKMASLLAGALLLVGCDDDRNPANAAVFRLAQNELPYPTDLHFRGSTDGTLNITAARNDAGGTITPIQLETNALDGFSTTSVIRERFGSPLNPDSLTASSVRVIEVTIDNSTKLITGVRRELVFGTQAASADFSARLATDGEATDGSVLEIVPLKPLSPSTGDDNLGYLVVLTNGIATAAGAAVEADRDYSRLRTQQARCRVIDDAQFNAACNAIANQLQTARSLGIDAASIVLTFSFSTQSSLDTLNALAHPDVTTAQPMAAVNTGITTRDLNNALPGHATLFKGTLRLPYYSSRPSAANPIAPLTASWQGAPSPLDPNSRFLTRFNPLPIATETIAIPVLVTVPNANSTGAGAKPATGWPVIVFQHGLMRNRLDALAIADAVADADADPIAAGVQGYVVVSIDLPLHGIADDDAVPTNPFFDASLERTFNFDLIDNDKLTPGPDGRIDPSGAHFVNLASLLTTRDNLRQSAADLLTLVRSLPALDLDGDRTADIDAARVHFVGHSLGGIAGGVLLGIARPQELRTGELASAGGGVARTIFDSPLFGPQFKAVLAAQGIMDGTRQFAEFVRDTQGIVDAGDPLNYIAAARSRSPLLLLQVVGGGALADGSLAPPDQVVVNSATQRLIDAAHLPRLSAVGDNPNSAGFVNFVLGNHASILSPAASLAATVEMQTQTISFASSQGAIVRITDRSVVQP